MKKLVYAFSEGSESQKELLGGKGANLAAMTSLGLPVPQGFTVTTVACIEYLKSKKLSDELQHQILKELSFLSKMTKKELGDLKNPLLVSVRSGAKFSMPGMMDTILNLGLNDSTVEAVAEKSNNRRFAYDCYRRLLQMFGDVVFQLDHQAFEKCLTQKKQQKGYLTDNQLTEADLVELVVEFKELYLHLGTKAFPQDPYEQLFLAIEAVFSSWDNQRAKTYRQLHNISDKLGTAVNIQEMVFGNYGENSGTGVVFTRNPSTGENSLFGEYLLNAQGEDVVAGIRTPQSINQLQQAAPSQYQQLQQLCQQLELHYRDMQDIEFTIEQGNLFLLQTRNGKRTANAALRIALDFYHNQLLTSEELLNRISDTTIEATLHSAFNEKDLTARTPLFSGLAASPGAAVGQIYFSAETALQAKKNNQKVILLREETSPEDISGMAASEAIITSRGGMTSHAAVVARGMGICSVVGCETLQIIDNEAIIGETKLAEGAWISVDGTEGQIYEGNVPLVEAKHSKELSELFEICQQSSPIAVRGNAETPKDIEKAIDFSASGIGLARTEHMFFEKQRLSSFRKLILATNQEMRSAMLTELKKVQKDDFKQIYIAAKGKPTTIRLLDPPLHEFLPKTEKEYQEIAKKTNRSFNQIKRQIEALAEVNPMLGFRGARLGLIHPEIYQMQAAAIIEAAIEVYFEKGYLLEPEIMIPFISEPQEFIKIRQLIEPTIQQIFEKYQHSLRYQIGTMIEIPRICFLADQLAEHADFFSFGTNDLTQMAYGLSRDDSAKTIQYYLEKELFRSDPFQIIDEAGVGSLLKLAIKNGRKVNSKLKIGICGEAAAHPESIRFLKTLNIDYISCSPYRIPKTILNLARN